jgi:hypothetical protein
MSEGEKRTGPRVRFDHERRAQMMAIDGTWRRDCIRAARRVRVKKARTKIRAFDFARSDQ